MVVELPADYQDSRVIPVEGFNRSVDDGYPFCAILHHDTALKVLYISTHWINGMDVSEIIYTRPGVKTIEDHLSKETTTTGSRQMTSAEDLISRGVERIAINSMLLLSDLGAKEKGYANESYAMRLQERLKKARKGKGNSDAATVEADLLMQPVVWGFAQDVVLHNERSEHSAGPHEDTGREMPPHWRRGHWRMQAYGEKGLLRKRLFIKPVLVNKHLVAGPTAATSTSYTLTST
jgi:hypothetical protein